MIPTAGRSQIFPEPGCEIVVAATKAPLQQRLNTLRSELVTCVLDRLPHLLAMVEPFREVWRRRGFAVTVLMRPISDSPFSFLACRLIQIIFLDWRLIGLYLYLGCVF